MSNSDNINTLSHYAFKYCNIKVFTHYSIVALTHYSIKDENHRNKKPAQSL